MSSVRSALSVSGMGTEVGRVRDIWENEEVGVFEGNRNMGLGQGRERETERDLGNLRGRRGGEREEQRSLRNMRWWWGVVVVHYKEMGRRSMESKP